MRRWASVGAILLDVLELIGDQGPQPLTVRVGRQSIANQLIEIVLPFLGMSRVKTSQFHTVSVN
jgi:hypothetical protein